MGWKENKIEHSKLWNSAVKKIEDSLSEQDREIAYALFSSGYGVLLDKQPTNKKMFGRAFTAWLILEFYKENVPLIDWAVKKYGLLSQEEKEVLLAAKEHRFDIFRIEEQTNECLKFADADEKEYIIETIDMPEVNVGVAAFAQIARKEGSRYFVPGIIAPWADDKAFLDLKKAKEFRSSWNNYLEGFFNHLVKEYDLSEKTADKHAENANLMLIFLEHETNISSFKDITKTMLKTKFKKFVKRHILNKVDLDKAYYSLYRFFEYLKEEKQIENAEILRWLKAR